MKTGIGRSKVTCPQCSRSGAAWRQHKSFTRPLFEGLSAGFVWVDRGAPDDPHIACARCGSRSREGEQVTLDDRERAA